MKKCTWEKISASHFGRAQNWDEYSNVLAFKELPGIFEENYVIPGHVGKLSQYTMAYTVRESITVY